MRRSRKLNGRELGIMKSAEGCFYDTITTIYSIAYISAESLTNSVDGEGDGSVIHT